MKNLFLIILVALGILLVIGYEELGMDIGIGVKNQIVVGVLFLLSAIVLKFYFNALKKNLITKDSELKKSKLEKLIENDPELKKLEQEMKDLIDEQIPILLRIKKNRPDHWKIMVEKGLVPEDLKADDEDSNEEAQNDSQKPSGSLNNDSIFVQFMVSTTMSYILFGVGVFFIYFLSPEGDPLNKGENGNGSWNLWVGLLIWVVMVLLYFFKDKLPKKEIENDPEIRKIDQEMRDLVDSQLPILLRLKKEHPDLWRLAIEKGLVGADLKDEDDDSNEDAKRDSPKPEGNES